MFEKRFKLKEHNTNVRTEITAGIVTFISMAYILAVNPAMLAQTGMNAQGVFMATALSACIATVMMAFYANLPIALASGMGVSTYFTYTICCGEMKDNPDAWKIALTAIFVEGVLFIILSLFRFREALVNKIPKNLKFGISAGIGLFISFIGFKNSGIVVQDSSTFVTLGDFKSPTLVLAIVGTLLIAVFLHFKIKGAILWGILATWILGIVAQIGGWYVVDVNAGMYSLIPQISGIGDFIPNFGALSETAFKMDFQYIISNTLNFAVIVFAFLYMDLFDTVGTLIGVAEGIGEINEKGEFPKAKQALLCDAVGTVVGAGLGTCTVTSYAESSTGVAEGGRTGLTSLTTGLLFIVAIFFWPIFSAIPSFATAPALIIVGMFMMTSVLKMDFTNDVADTLSGFLAIIIMPITYSIANGIMFGILSWIIIKVCTGKVKDISGIMWCSFALFVLRIISLIFA